MRFSLPASLALALTVPAVLMGQAARTQVACDPDNGGLTLPSGFCALVVAPETGGARHLAVAANGDMYVALRTADKPGGVVALRDTNGGGRAECGNDSAMSAVPDWCSTTATCIWHRTRPWFAFR
jgi:hypothetical protein